MKVAELMIALAKMPLTAEIVFCQDEHTHYEVIDVTYNDLGHLACIQVD